MKRRRRLELEQCGRLAGVDTLDLFQRRAQLVVADQHAAPDATEPETFVDANEIGRGVGVDAQAGGLQRRAQISERRALAIGPGDVDPRRQLALGVTEPLKQAVHPLHPEIDAFLMQGRQPPDQFAERRLCAVSGRVHACGAAGATSGANTICAGLVTGCADFDAVSGAGDLVKRRQSRAKVGRKSWRCTTMSTIPCSFRYSARWKPSGSFSRMVCSSTRAPAKPISAPVSAICTSPSIA